MPAYWLTFKPLSPAAPRGWPIEDLRDLVQRFDVDPTSTAEWWRIASYRAAHVGDRVYAFKQGDGPRGIFGVGRILDGPKLKNLNFDGLRYRALIRFEKLVDPTKGFLLTLKQISDIVSANLIDSQASGVGVPRLMVPEIERRLALS
jgi:putative restriction endonuclease